MADNDNPLDGLSFKGLCEATPDVLIDALEVICSVSSDLRMEHKFGRAEMMHIYALDHLWHELNNLKRRWAKARNNGEMGKENGDECNGR